MPEDVGNNSSNNDNNTKLTQAEIIGIIIGTLVITGIFAVVISLIVALIKRRHRRCMQIQQRLERSVIIQRNNTA